MTLTSISCSSDFYTFYVNVPLSLGCMIRKVSAEDIAIRGNGTGLEYMCPTRHFVYIFFNPVFQVSTAKNEINLFNNHILIEAPVTFAPAGAMTPSAEFLFLLYPRHTKYVGVYSFRFYTRPFIRSFVRTFVRSYVRSFVRSSFRHRVKVFALKFIRPHILKTL